MPRTRDEAEHDAMKTQIKAVARAQMRANGTAGVALRAIARELALTAPALYRYFPKLDDLITALIVDAFNGLADALEAADAAVNDQTDYEARLMAVCLAYRDYALANPIDYQLIYGNPIPGYVGPGDITIPSSTRVNVAITRVFIEAEAAGKYRVPYIGEFVFMPEALVRTRAIAEQYGIKPEVIAASTALWALIHGMIVLDLDSHLAPIIDVASLYRNHVLLFFRGMT